MGNSENIKNDRRKYLRIGYHPSERPVIKIGKREFEISDLNEKGLGLLDADEIDFDKKIMGLIIFKNGRIIGIEGRPIWRKDKKMGIEFSNPFPVEKIIHEHKLRSDKFE